MESNIKGKTFLSAKLRLACVKLVDRFRFLQTLQTFAIANSFLPPKLRFRCVSIFLQRTRCEKILTPAVSWSASLCILASFWLSFT